VNGYFSWKKEAILLHGLEIFGIAVLRLFDDLADPGVSAALFLKK
jgi:hypothetical protein